VLPWISIQIWIWIWGSFNNKSCSLHQTLSPENLSTFFKVWKLAFGANQNTADLTFLSNIKIHLGPPVSLFLCFTGALLPAAALPATCCRTQARDQSSVGLSPSRHSALLPASLAGAPPAASPYYCSTVTAALACMRSNGCTWLLQDEAIHSLSVLHFFQSCRTTR
jgi:hypothetical protein